jgi:DNA invertase Pin-like site-specific DNA recombinase
MTSMTVMGKSFPTVRDELGSTKIRPEHQERWAVVYVRQSTAQQVLHHQESTRLQYGLTRRAELLGWSADRILVIDDDLGKSGASAVGRVGFQRLVSEVSLDHIGIILGIEMSRLARSCADWHQLLEICALFRTLIADLDGIYDPSQYNDRLLLGLKGTMSEAELHILKQRMDQGRLNKARRGDLRFALPVGYVWSADEGICLDPDEQVRDTVHLIFRTFDEVGTLGGLVRFLARNNVQLGIRVREGPGKGNLVWRRPNRMTLQNLLTHPIYAGAYAYGRRQDDPRRKRSEQTRSGRGVMARSDWHVLLPDQCPTYISWDHYERNLARLHANRARAETMGAVRQGAALLAGLVVCARCACRLGVHYDGGTSEHYIYECVMRWNNYGEPRCQHVAGPCLDSFVSHQVLAALAPAALELSLAATERLEEERAEVEHLWQQRRERAGYEVERAARQYHAVEPENRLVVRTLERAWEDKLTAQQQLEEEYHRFGRAQPRLLTGDERASIRQLATDIPSLWNAATTTPADRKEIIRQVVERVLVDAEGTSERVRVRLDWVGGGHTTGEVIRPVGKLSDLSSYPQLCERVRQLTEAGWAATAIADHLNDEGYHPAHASARFGAPTIRTLQRQLAVTTPRPRVRTRTELGPEDWWPADLGRTLDIPKSSLYHWIRQGIVRARQLDEPLHRWIIWADEAEKERLRAYQRRSIGDEMRSRWQAGPDDVATRSHGTSVTRNPDQRMNAR